MPRHFVTPHLPASMPCRRGEAERAREVDGIVYASLLPSEQMPSLGSNKIMMDKFCPLMKRHYRQTRPKFRA